MLLRSRLYILSLLCSVGREIIQKNKWKKARNAVDLQYPKEFRSDFVENLATKNLK
jgi:hypothetical protein